MGKATAKKLITVGAARGNRYTRKDDEQLIAMFNNKVTAKVMGVKLGRSENSIRARLYNVIQLLTTLDHYDYESGRKMTEDEIKSLKKKKASSK